MIDSFTLLSCLVAMDQRLVTETIEVVKSPIFPKFLKFAAAKVHSCKATKGNKSMMGA